MEFNIVLRMNAIDVPLKDLKKSIIEDLSNGVKSFCHKMLSSVLEEAKKTDNLLGCEKEELNKLRKLVVSNTSCTGENLLTAIKLVEKQYR